MITVATIVDPNVRRVLDRASGKDFVNFLRRDVRARAKPVLEQARALTPVQSGRLRASLAIMGMTTPSQGTVSAIVRPRDEFTFKDASKKKRLVYSAKTKKPRIEKAVARGWALDAQAPFLYAYGIETGKRRDGKIARRKGPARMLENSAKQGAEQFASEVATDTFRYLTTGMG